MDRHGAPPASPAHESRRRGEGVTVITRRAKLAAGCDPAGIGVPCSLSITRRMSPTSRPTAA